MRAGLFWLNDRQWTRIERHLPNGLPGPERDDDRRIISGIIHMLQSGALAHLRLPVLIVSAGQEQLVDNKSHEVVGDLLPNARRMTIANAKHEILMERDDVRAQFWAAFDELADRVAPRIA